MKQNFYALLMLIFSLFLSTSNAQQIARVRVVEDGGTGTYKAIM